MLFAIHDRKRWIEIGYGLEGILNDAKVGDIGRDMVPALRAEITRVIAADSAVTLTDTTQTAAENATTPQPIEAAPPSSALSGGKWILIAFPILWFLLIFAIIFSSIRKAIHRRAATGSSRSDSGSSWSDTGSSFGSESSGSDSFSGGDGGSSGGGGAGGDW